jgi:hypothetical protein
MITINPTDLAEALQKERAVARAHDELHLAQNDLGRFVAHIRTLYSVPEEYVLTNWLDGFGPGVDNGE